MQLQDFTKKLVKRAKIYFLCAINLADHEFMANNKGTNIILSLTTGTASLCFCWFFWPRWWGILISMFSIILAIIAMVAGKKAKRFYRENKENLTAEYKRNARLGFKLGVAGLIISLICFLLAILSTIYLTILA